MYKTYRAFRIRYYLQLCSIRVLLLLPIVVSGCGIPSFIYIASANRDTVDATTIEFYHNTNNNIDQFTGYDIYYKFYENNNDGHTRCRGDKDYIDNTNVVVLGTPRLTSRQFRRMIKNDNENAIPVVTPPNKSSAHRFILTIADWINISSRSTITNSPDTVILYRNATESSTASNYKPLNGHASYFSPNDVDINGIVSNINTLLVNEDLNIAFYAIGYGFGNNFQVIYGEAAFLGYVSLFGLTVHPNCS